MRRDAFLIGWSIVAAAAIGLLAACSSSGGSNDASGGTDSGDNDAPMAASVDITNVIFDERSADCADYDNTYVSSVMDIQRALGFAGDVLMEAGVDDCTLTTNNIPNHDFNDLSASFATDVSEVPQNFVIARNPSAAASPTPLSQRTYNGVMLNGVPIDLLSAGCYDPTSPMADADGNVPIGCRETDPWLLDPLGPASDFGVDGHHAHTQPNGSYHYHGNPNAMFDDFPGPSGSPVIGFAADGFPIYGSYFLDPASGAVRKAESGYTLRAGTRPSSATDPGGSYDGTYVDDWEYTAAGDLDACNGMTVDGQYGYYVTDSYPWILGCLTGTPDDSFDK